MNGKIIVDTEGLRIIASSIQEKKNKIVDVYNSRLKDVLYNSKDCLKQGGHSYEELDAEFKKMFSDLDNNINELTDVLVNKIIPRYENLSDDIKAFFNKQFAETLSQLLEIEEK